MLNRIARIGFGGITASAPSSAISRLIFALP